MITDIRDAAVHPAALVSYLLTVVSQLFHIPFVDALAGVLWSNVPTLFTATSIGAFTVVPNVDGIPAIVGETLQVVALLLAVTYGGKLLYGVVLDAKERID